MNKTTFNFNYRTCTHVLLISIGIYASFIGKTHITSINISKGIQCTLFLFIILSIVQIPEFIAFHMTKRKEIKEEKR